MTRTWPAPETSRKEGETKGSNRESCLFRNEGDRHGQPRSTPVMLEQNLAVRVVFRVANQIAQTRLPIADFKARDTSMRRTITGFAICLALAGIAAAQQSLPPQDKFIDRLLENRYQLKLQDGKLSGPALPVLQSALSGAQFVLIGEDHGISQIPQFAGAVCDMVGQEGFHTLAVEAGPLAARELRPWIERDDGPRHLIEF